jgi:hypothetical protein
VVRETTPFHGTDAYSYFRAVQEEIREEISRLAPKDVLGTTDEQWVEHFVSKFRFTSPGLDEGNIRVDPIEVRVRAEKFDRHHVRGFDPDYITMMRTSYEIPVTGDIDLLQLQPQTRTYLNNVTLQDNLLVWASTDRDEEPSKLKQRFEQQLGYIRGNIESLAKSVEEYNAQIETSIPKWVAQRRAKVEADAGKALSLGYPLKKREDSPTVIATPVRRVMPRPLAGAAQAPEPGLVAQQYEDILGVCRSMSLAMERSPSTFAKMGEEEIRDFFLVALNGQFQGMATGETFNFEGKTDILIRERDRSVFVAECKIWGGQKHFLDTIDQILGYLTWRDAKSSILVFFRGRWFTKMIETARAAVRLHPNFVRDEVYADESGFRCVLRHRDDPDREMILTVLAFHVPGDIASADAADATLDSG